LVVAVAAIAAGGLRGGGAALTPLDRLLAFAGFSLTQVSLTGHRFTSDDDIYEALDLAHARTVPLFDCRAAQRRIEGLPFVATASVARVLPDRLEVEIRERTPAAVWQKGEASVLIDATGRVLAAVASTAAVTLPRVTGDGAAAATGELLLLLSHHPALRGELALAERVGERRWTLWLAGGGSILLPAADADAALDRAAAIADALAGHALRIDLRTASRALVSDAPPRAAVSGSAPHDHTDTTADIGSARLGEVARGQTGDGA
jgi:cell division protein FtsQ